MTLQELLCRIDKEVYLYGSQAAAAKAWGVSPQYLSDILHGRREPGEGLLLRWGFRKVVTYEREQDAGPQNVSEGLSVAKGECG